MTGAYDRAIADVNNGQIPVHVRGDSGQSLVLESRCLHSPIAHGASIVDTPTNSKGPYSRRTTALAGEITRALPKNHASRLSWVHSPLHLLERFADGFR